MANKKKTAKTTKTTTAKTTTNSSSTTHYEIIKFCAYWGLVIAAVVYLVSFILSVLLKCGITMNWAHRVIGVCNTVSQVALLVTVIFAAWKYVRNKRKVYKIFFCLGVGLALLGLVGINLI